ncbi:hypothetical protein [Desulfobulbus alkaliphilus]|uniref:hypothetical protein n=1 Tax=Desulfobulbus alkaliphilus TaxID=869814 RepID=UPI001963523E|nr:hypothetical protein [Desulfobulbus alkaliphilus]MBM9537930.1 hypothetical protein [Desulfobulbus alkaliphilus]
MWITLTLGAAVVLLLACEKWIGGCPAMYADDPSYKDQCHSSPISLGETTFGLLPIFLGGIGLPMVLALPILGLSCLLISLGLFFAGKKLCLLNV